MPKITSTETEIDVKRLSKEKYSYRQIKNKLIEEDVDVSIATICRILKNIGIRRSAKNNKQPVPQYRTLPIKRTPANVQKVKRLANKKNPATRRDIQKQTSLSLDTIHKIIHKDLKLETKNSLMPSIKKIEKPIAGSSMRIIWLVKDPNMQ
jgi:arginine repressor